MTHKEAWEQFLADNLYRLPLSNSDAILSWYRAAFFAGRKTMAREAAENLAEGKKRSLEEAETHTHFCGTRIDNPCLACYHEHAAKTEEFWSEEFAALADDTPEGKHGE